jgi:hypothetical protein
MRIAIMQPYFFPYIGYFQLIQAADRFFVCDEVQYIRHGWINRNRISSNSPEGFSYIIMPVKKHAHTAAIKTIQCVDGNDWKEKILTQIQVYKKAPHYREVQKFLQHCFQHRHTGVSNLNVYFLQQTVQYIGLNKTIEVHEEGRKQYTDRNERPVDICKENEAAAYINMIGGKALYDKDFFTANGIALSFLQPVVQPYLQPGAFVPGLSVIDAMMYNTPAELRMMIADHEIVPA